MSDLFISYSREDKEFVARLHSALEQRDRSAWVDWEGIPPTAEWLNEIFEAIDAAQAFVFVLTPSSVASEVCRKELGRAIDQNKRLIPIVFREADHQLVPERLRQINWIFLRSEDDFAAGITTLIQAIDTDLDRVKAHTRLLVRAVEWKTLGLSSLLLRGRDMADAEAQFVAEAEKEPKPTALQLRYLAESRKRAIKVQRIILGSVIFGMAVAVTLAIVAGVQRQYSELRAGSAFVRNVAAAKPMLASTYAVNEMGRALSNRVPEVRSSLLSALQMPKESTLLEQDKKLPVAEVVATPSGSLVAVLDARFADDSGDSLIVWSGSGDPRRLAGLGSKITAVAGCSTDSLAMIGTEAGFAQLWDIEAGSQLGELAATNGALVGSEANIEGGGSGSSPTEVPRPQLDADGEDPDGPSFFDPYDDMFDDPDPAEAEAVTVPPPVGERSPCSSDSEAVRAAAFSSDCGILAIARDCSTEIWSATPTAELLVSVPEATPARAVAVDETRRTVLRGFSDGSIRAVQWDGGDDREIARNPTGEAVSVLAVNPSGGQIAAAEGDMIRLWQERNGSFQPLGAGLHGHDDRVTAVVFEPESGAYIASGSRDNTIRLWDEMGNELGEPLRGHDSWVRTVGFSDGGHSILSSSNDGTVRLWPAPARFSEISCRDVPSCDLGGAAEVLAVTEDDTLLIRVGDAAMSAIYTQTRNCDCSLEDQVSREEGKLLAAMTPNGRLMAVGIEGGSEIRLRDLGGEIDVVAHPEGGVRAVALSPDGSTLAIGGSDKIVRTWNRIAGTFGELPEEHDLAIVSLAFSFDGRTLASGSEDNSVQLWDLELGQQQGPRLRGHKGWISSVAFSPDGQFVSSGSWDKTLRLWDRDGNPMGGPMVGHSSRITHMKFHPEDASLVSYGYDQRIGRWPGGGPQDWLAASCAQLIAHPGVKHAEENLIYQRARASCSRD